MTTFPFSSKILQSSTLTKQQEAVIVNLGDGNSQRAGIGKTPFYDTWTIELDLAKTDAQTLIAFYKQHGVVKGFTFTDPFGDTKPYLFESFQYVELNSGRVQFTITIKQTEETI